jgi:hypothetical protein
MRIISDRLEYVNTFIVGILSFGGHFLNILRESPSNLKNFRGVGGMQVNRSWGVAFLAKSDLKVQ